MLKQLFDGRQPEPIHVVLPVELMERNPRKSRPLKSAARKRRAGAKKSRKSVLYRTRLAWSSRNV